MVSRNYLSGINKALDKKWTDFLGQSIFFAYLCRIKTE